MNNTVYANEELAYLFEEYDKNGKSLKENEEVLALYKLDDIKIPERGSVISGKYMGILGDQYLIKVNGFKDDIRIDVKQSESKYLKNTNIGDIIDVLISNVDNDNFLISGSISSLYESKARLSIDMSLPALAHIKSLSPAGYEIDILHDGVTLPGFMPNTLAGINKLYDQSLIVGKTFEVMIESFSQEEGTYIVSRRKYLQTLIPSAVKKLEYGEVYTGHVTGTTPFGVFVEFNECLTGMIHKANVNPEWQEKLTSISPGFMIDFYIKEVIKDKIILTQILRETLWDNIRNGQTLNGKVRDTKQFGTLVNLDDETVGLIHTSEMERLGKKYTSGQDIKVKVLSVDRLNRKIFLTVA
jgi:ribosomal protein S1